MIKIRQSDSSVLKSLFEINDSFDFILTGSLALHLQGFLDPERPCSDLDLIFTDKEQFDNFTKKYGAEDNNYDGDSKCTYINDVKVDIIPKYEDIKYNIIELTLGSIKCAIPQDIIQVKLEFSNNNKKHILDLKYYEELTGIKLDYPEVKKENIADITDINDNTINGLIHTHPETSRKWITRTISGKTYARGISNTTASQYYDINKFQDAQNKLNKIMQQEMALITKSKIAKAKWHRNGPSSIFDEGGIF